MEPKPSIENLLRQVENIMNIEDGPLKSGLIDAAIATVRAMHARREITDSQRRRLFAILCDPHVGNPFSEN